MAHGAPPVLGRAHKYRGASRVSRVRGRMERRQSRRYGGRANADAYYTGTARGAHSRYRWAWARAAPCAAADVERGSERRAARAAAQAWLDEHAPRATGREALLAKKKERAASHRAMAERRQLDDDVADGLSEDALLGTDSSFAAAYVVLLTQDSLSASVRQRGVPRHAKKLRTPETRASRRGSARRLIPWHNFVRWRPSAMADGVPVGARPTRPPPAS